MKRLLRIIFAVFFVPAMGAVSAQAQIYECNGQWTNKPCEGSVTKQFAEQPAEVQDPEDADRARRKQWLHELDMLSLEAKRRYGVVPVLGPIQDLCLNESSTADECREAVAARERELQTLMAEYAKADAQKNSDSSEASKSDSGTNVTIINQQPPVVYVVPRRRHIETYYTGGTSVSLNASGTVGGSNVSVGVSAASGSGFGSGVTSSGLQKPTGGATNFGSTAPRPVAAPPSSSLGLPAPVRPPPVPRAQPVRLERLL